MNIVIDNNNLHVFFRVRESGVVELADFSCSGKEIPIREIDEKEAFQRHSHPIIEMQITGQSSTNSHAYRHNASSEAEYLRYASHSVSENKEGKLLQIEMSGRFGLTAVYSMQFYKNIDVVRVYSEIKNEGAEDVGIEYVTSFIYDGICKNGKQPYYDKTDIWIPHNSWSNEAQWHKEDAADLGLSIMPVSGYNLSGSGNNRYAYGSTVSWSTCQYLPIAVAEDRETGEIYFGEIDYSGAWEIEYGSGTNGALYCALLGPNEEDMWWKNLKPGQAFVTVPVAFGTLKGDAGTAVRELTKYRRAIRRPNKDDDKCYVVFNDYMNCLMGDPTEEKEKEIIDKAAALGCEYYCMDCGWYDKGFWWDRVGEWKESEERFPNGLKTVYDYARSKGLKMGMWLEIEVMGTACKMAEKLPDSWFFCMHGKRRVDNHRYLLDFRNPEVRSYCRSVIDRLIHDYGCEYFKVDYNVTTGFGSDLSSDSPGDSMLEHYRCLYEWYQDIFRSYPDLVIENCGSGAQRMDYGMLSLLSLQSTSDQTDYILNSFIAANVASAVTPEQAGMWVYPYVDEREHIIYNMVNGMLLRPYISGLVWTISEEGLNLFREGIDVYKSIRDTEKDALPFFPLGFTNSKASVLAYGLQKENIAYLSVFMPDADKADIPLKFEGKEIKAVSVLYPGSGDCKFAYEDGALKVVMPQKKCARFFKIDLM